MSATPAFRAVVVGAGIGGLTAAAALHRRGWNVTVLERAPRLEPVGAGIALAPNAQRALDVIGLGDAVRTMSGFQGEGGLRTPAGRWLSRMNSDAAAARFGGPVAVAHRAALVDLLRTALPAGALHTGTPVLDVDPRSGRVGTADGDLDADLVVGADGIHSAVRARLFPGHPGPAYSGFTSWRMVTEPPAEPFAPHETWGRGQLWGTVPLPDGRVYCYATAVAPPGGHAPGGDERAELRRLFGDWHAPVPTLVAAAPPGAVLRNDVHALTTPLPAFHRGRTALVGDAAHAMTPNLGQGGCQAVEDAIVLAHHARPGADLGEALAAYTADRLPRTTAVVRRSWRAGRFTTWRSAPAVALRDTLFAALGRLGPGLALRTFDGIADWRPPAETGTAGPGTAGPGTAEPGTAEPGTAETGTYAVPHENRGDRAR